MLEQLKPTIIDALMSEYSLTREQAETMYKAVNGNFKNIKLDIDFPLPKSMENFKRMPKNGRRTLSIKFKKE